MMLADVAGAGWTVGIGLSKQFEGLDHSLRLPRSPDSGTAIEIASWKLEPSEDGVRHASNMDAKSSVAFYVGVAAAALGFRQFRGRHTDPKKNWELVGDRPDHSPH